MDKTLKISERLVEILDYLRTAIITGRILGKKCCSLTHFSCIIYKTYLPLLFGNL